MSIDMYQAVYNKDGSLKHSHFCNMVFGKKDPKCHRCMEMLNGSPARSGWQKGYFQRKKHNDEMHLRAIREHNLEACMKKNIVCTCFEW